MKVVVTFDVRDDYGTERQTAQVPKWIAQGVASHLGMKDYLSGITVAVDGGPTVEVWEAAGYRLVQP